MRTILLIDANLLCHRAYHTTGHLHFGDVGTGVAFGFFREVINLYDKFSPSGFVFCFDGRKTHRAKACPTYKATRQARYDNATKEEQDGIEEFRRQVWDLENNTLPAVGYSNTHSYPGYEADDLIAALAQRVTKCPDNEVIIISSDQDLWQCLGPRVLYYSPHTQELLTEEKFKATWGLEPSLWPMVKAWAGCRTDDVDGVPGVGEKTAAKYIKGELTKGKAYEAIKANQHIYDANLPLVTLPWPGCPTPKLYPDKVTAKRWGVAMASLGFASLTGFAPGHLGGSGMPAGIKGFGFNGK